MVREDGQQNSEYKCSKQNDPRMVGANVVRIKVTSSHALLKDKFSAENFFIRSMLQVSKKYRSITAFLNILLFWYENFIVAATVP